MDRVRRSSSISGAQGIFGGKGKGEGERVDYHSRSLRSWPRQENYSRFGISCSCNSIKPRMDLEHTYPRRPSTRVQGSNALRPLCRMCRRTSIRTSSCRLSNVPKMSWNWNTIGGRAARHSGCSRIMHGPFPSCWPMECTRPAMGVATFSAGYSGGRGVTPICGGDGIRPWRNCLE